MHVRIFLTRQKMNAFLQNAQIDIEIDVQLRQILNQIKEKSLDANVK